MKKFIIVLAMSLCVSAISCISALAADSDAISIGAAAVAAAESASDWYEASVIARMAGRAGSSTVKGAKGNVFEVLWADKQNSHSLFSGTKTKLSRVAL